MLEARRRAYMKAMGVVQFSPISAIDGASVSPVLLPEQVYPELVDVPYVEEAVPQETVPQETFRQASPDVQVPQSQVIPPPVEALTSDANQLQTNQAPSNKSGPDTSIATQNVTVKASFSEAALQHDGPPPTPDIKITPLDEAAPVAPEKKGHDEVLRFALTMVEIPGKLLVLADLSDANAMGCSAMEYHLLQAVLKSISLEAEPSQHLFRWPLINNKRMAQGKAEAAEGLQGFLMSKLEVLQTPNLLLIGEFASGFMPGQDAQAVMDFAGYKAHCFRIPSLQNMLNDWQYKPQAWATLVSMTQRLNSL
ncbi:MAG: hypothetical protein KUG73_09360 [Pseudomonadales bacterium]|nr:hypothetical protein [Pseudomonadales bacterium]